MRLLTFLLVSVVGSTAYAQYCGPGGCQSGFGMGLGFYDTYCPPPVAYSPYPTPDVRYQRQSPSPRKQQSDPQPQRYLTVERYERDLDIYNANAKQITKRLDDLASSQEDISLKLKYLNSRLKSQSANMSSDDTKQLLTKLDSLSVEITYLKKDLAAVRNQSELSSNQKKRTLSPDSLYFKIEESPTP